MICLEEVTSASAEDMRVFRERELGMVGDL